jgi:hypothetical protein
MLVRRKSGGRGPPRECAVQYVPGSPELSKPTMGTEYDMMTFLYAVHDQLEASHRANPSELPGLLEMMKISMHACWSRRGLK